MWLLNLTGQSNDFYHLSKKSVITVILNLSHVISVSQLKVGYNNIIEKLSKV